MLDVGEKPEKKEQGERWRVWCCKLVDVSIAKRNKNSIERETQQSFNLHRVDDVNRLRIIFDFFYINFLPIKKTKQNV